MRWHRGGVWQGEQKCDVYDGSKSELKYGNDTMFISQDGSSLTVAALCSEAGGCFLFYRGLVADDDKDPAKKGQAGMTVCSGGPSGPYQETARATKLEIKKDGKAEFEATSIFYQTVESPVVQVGTCTWKYKRVAAVVLDPPVPTCDELGPTLTAPSNAAKGGFSPRRP